MASLVNNRYGQPLRYNKEEITLLDQLKPGDHIAYEQLKLYWHHMIVEKVDLDGEKPIHVIHYYNTPKDFLNTFPKKAEVRRDSFAFSPEKIFRVVYQDPDQEINPAEKVVELARNRLGEQEYNAAHTNCEHFCTQCKINVNASPQVEILENWILTRLTNSLLNLPSETTFMLAEREVLILERLAYWGMKIGLPILCVLVDSAFAAKDIYEAYKRRQNNLITKEQLWNLTKTRLLVLIVPAPIYFLAQFLIPVPFVGLFVGIVLHCFARVLVGIAIEHIPKSRIWKFLKKKINCFFQWTSSSISRIVTFIRSKVFFQERISHS